MTPRRAAAPDRRERRPRARAPVASVAPVPPAGGGVWRVDLAWLGVGALGVLVLLWTCRSFPPGVPVADDYSFLARLAFQKPLDLFDSMGATYYWRPLSRQLYFSMVGGALLEAPWIAALVHVAALLVTYVALWSSARRAFSAPVAMAIALLPLLSESARALLAWPSGAQHLFAGMFAAVALHEAFAARTFTALAAAGLGLLSHESAVLALGAVPVVAWARLRTLAAAATDHARARRHAVIATLGALVIAALWAWGYATALGHGVALPPQAQGEFVLARLPALLSRALPAALNLEDLATLPHTALVLGYASIGLLALLRLRARARRARLRHAIVALGVGLAWFALGAVPLAQLLPDWNAWRAWLPALGLGTGMGVALGFVHAPLAIAFAGLRLVALLFAPPGPATVAIEAPPTGSHMSYVRLVRLQRTVESTRRALRAAHREFPHGAAVKFWNLPQLAEVGFQGPAALRVWYGDSTLSWSRFGGVERIGQDVDALVEYRDFTAAPAQALERPAFEAYFRAALAMTAGREHDAEAEFDRAERATRTRGPLYASVAFNRAWLATGGSNAARADSLLRVAREFGEKEDADYWALTARIAMVRGDGGAAVSAVQRCLALDPRHATGLVIARALGATEAP